MFVFSRSYVVGVYGAAQPAFGPTPVMNQTAGLMAGTFNPLVQVFYPISVSVKNVLNLSWWFTQGNMYASPMYPAAGAAAGAVPMTQLTQQLGGLNFGTPAMMGGPAAPIVPG